MRPKPVPNAASDDTPVSEAEAVLYLGFRARAELLQRVAEGGLTPAGKHHGKHSFTLGELRRYSRDTAEATAATLAEEERAAAQMRPEALARLRGYAAARGLGLADATAELRAEAERTRAEALAGATSDDPERQLRLELIRVQAMLPERPREALAACLRAVEAHVR